MVTKGRQLQEQLQSATDNQTKFYITKFEMYVHRFVSTNVYVYVCTGVNSHNGKPLQETRNNYNL